MAGTSIWRGIRAPSGQSEVRPARGAAGPALAHPRRRDASRYGLSGDPRGIFLGGNARQNPATFVTTWMEPQATALHAEAFDKNMIDTISEKLRARGWQVPAYPMPEDIEDMTVMGIVVRNGVSMDLVELLLDDLRAAIAYLDSLEAPMPKEHRRDAGFHH